MSSLIRCVTIRISTNLLLEKRISELKAEIAGLEHELHLRKKELTVMEGGRRRLVDQTLHLAREPDRQISTKRPIVVQSKSLSLARAARNILRERGQPMRSRKFSQHARSGSDGRTISPPEY